MSSEIKQLPISSHDNHRRIIFLAKEILNSNEKIELIASTNSAPAATRAAENLVRLGYVTFEDIQTTTEIHEGRRIKLIITLKKTANFQKFRIQILGRAIKKIIPDSKKKKIVGSSN